MKLVSEYMTKDIVHVKDDCLIVDAVKIMNEKGIGSILIFDHDNKPIGIFTERDLLKKIELDDPARISTQKISSVMTKTLKTVGESVPYTDVIRLMKQSNVRHMPVMNNGNVVGIVSLRDLMNHYEENLERFIEEKQSQLVQSTEDLKLANQDLLTNEKALRTMIKDKEKTQHKLIVTQKQLIQSEKMASIGKLAAGIAHEIKNPLGIILQGVERIEKNISKVKGQEKNEPFIRMVKSATERANRVVYTLLKYSRSSQTEIEPLDISKIIDGAIELVTNSAKLKKVEIVKKYSQDNYLIYGDPVTLQQIFVDLITNGIDAIDEQKGGKITINIDYKLSEAGTKERGAFIISIEDTGYGIEPQNLTKIFDPFYTTKDEKGGTGLGLSTVYLILDQHKGSISVESEPGKGTRFSITLPLNLANQSQELSK